MTTLWAIEATPLNGKGKPGVILETLSRTRREAFAKLREGGEPLFLRAIKRHQRKGLLRAVKVTVQLAKEKP